MTRHRYTLEVDVDDLELEGHVLSTGGNAYPLVADPSEFTWDDLNAALERGLAESPEIVDYDVVAERS